MDTTPNQKTIRDLESAFWEAMQSKDSGAAERMTDDKCIIVGAQGVSSIDPESMARMTREGAWEIRHYEFDQTTMQVSFLTEDIAMIAYAVTEDLVFEGKPITLKANDSSVWIRRADGWRCALHTESVAGDPFGRNRQGD